MSSKGAVGFAQFYTTMYGARWPAITAALLADKQHVAVIHPHSQYMPDTPSPQLADVTFAHVIATHHAPPQPTESGFTNYYLLDAASILAVEALDITPGERVVDLCAAPGGKSLLCVLKLDGRGQLIANDRSNNRRPRITRILDEYLPPAQ